MVENNGYDGQSDVGSSIEDLRFDYVTKDMSGKDNHRVNVGCSGVSDSRVGPPTGGKSLDSEAIAYMVSDIAKDGAGSVE